MSAPDSSAAVDAARPLVDSDTPPGYPARAVQLLRRPTVRSAVFLAAALANTVIVETGALVRLTTSGLGCPTWPRCTTDSLVTTSAMGVHGVVEFTNRMLTFALTVVVIAAVVVALVQRPRRRDLIGLSGALFAGIVAQAVLGGITVLTHLNPWTVAAHLLVSMVLIAAALVLHERGRQHDRAMTPARPAGEQVHVLLRRLGTGLVAVTGVVLVLGTVVTGSGPHAGASVAARTGFDVATVSQLHADAVMVLIGLTVATWVAAVMSGAPTAVRRGCAALVIVELAQGTIGYVQYFTGVPVALVAFHVVGACATWWVVVVLRLRMRQPAPPALR